MDFQVKRRLQFDGESIHRLRFAMGEERLPRRGTQLADPPKEIAAVGVAAEARNGFDCRAYWHLDAEDLKLPSTIL